MKILFLPPPNIELYFFYVDWMIVLQDIGVQVVGFEEHFHKLVGNVNSMREIVNEVGPDLVLGFDQFFMGFKVDKGVLFVSVFEEQKVPYIPIFTGDYLDQVFGSISPVRFFSYLRGIVVCDDQWEVLVNRFLSKPSFSVRFPLDKFGKFEPSNVDRRAIIRNMDAWEKRMDGEYVVSETEVLFSQILDKAKDGLSVIEVLDALGEEICLCPAVLSLFMDVESKCQIEMRNRIKRQLSEIGVDVEMRVVFNSIHQLVETWHKWWCCYSGLNLFSNALIDRFSYFSIRSGGFPLLLKPNGNVIGLDLPIFEVLPKLGEEKYRRDWIERIREKMKVPNWKEDVVKFVRWVEDIL